MTVSRYRATQRNIVFSCGTLLCVLLNVGTVEAKATTATLAELTNESQLIVYGHLVAASESSSAPSSTRLHFKAINVIKGHRLISGNIALLCNRRPNTEWPDLSTLAGNQVLFLVKSGDCFNLSHNYRSVVKVQNDLVATGEIKDQPEERSLNDFLEEVRGLASKK